MRAAEVTMTAQTPEGFMVARAGREHCKGNRAPYFSCGVDVYRSRRAWEVGAESRPSIRAGGDSEARSRATSRELVPIAAMSGAWTDNGEPMHGGANGWYWLSGAALYA
jgi:hypothetical protein